MKNNTSSDSVKVGIGDDGAVLSTVETRDLVVVTDTIVEGTHFIPGQSAATVGHKALSINLSDLAAMGAEPDWVTLNLVLPEADSTWLEEFSAGFFELANRHSVALVGGDTTHGPLSITVTAGGWVPCGQAIRRSNAETGDLVYVSGTLGDAALGLSLILNGKVSIDDKQNYFLKRFMWPEPRVCLGQLLRSLSTSAIDISDGLISDLGHIASASGERGAVVYENLIPVNSEAKKFCAESEILAMALSGGDDYELCFSVCPANKQAINRLGLDLGLPLTLVGYIDATPGVRVLDEQGRLSEIDNQGYLHHW